MRLRNTIRCRATSNALASTCAAINRIRGATDSTNNKAGVWRLWWHPHMHPAPARVRLFQFLCR
jgi:hypothetical protein